jgi:NhaA family Na+:H+ antiporter
MEPTPPSDLARLPAEPVDRVTGPLRHFLHIEAASGILLLIVTAIALILANSPLADEFLILWKMPFGFRFGRFEMVHSLRHWIDDGLMTIFFFVVGLEVKRELVVGELRDLRSAALPIVAALGGMVAPAALYLALQYGTPSARGWGIPMATDIAFVVGCMAVLGPRVPAGLRILLLSLAIADDIGAILVIAIGYTSHLNLMALGWGIAGLVAVVVLTRVGVRSHVVYLLVGALVWYAFHESGVHATVAGVILGLLAPAQPWVSKDRLRAIMDAYAKQEAAVETVETAARESVSPLERFETMLHPWVSFVIMPVFALANAGVQVDAHDFRDPVALAVMVGLVLGKPIGIVSFSWVAVRCGLARLPAGVSWSVLAAGGVLAGIGFTMALFIAGLALEDEPLNAAKVGVLSASALCAVVGVALLAWLLPRPATA